MKIDLQKIPVRDVVAGYIDSAEDGVVGYGGRLNIRPKYQREFVYKDKQRDDVIRSILAGFPLNVMYWVKNETGFELLDGQQRTISIAQYISSDFSIDEIYFGNIDDEPKRQRILDYELMVYICEGSHDEVLDWFEIINIAGEKLTDQERRNAVYTGPWLSAAKSIFSKQNCPAYKLGSNYIDTSGNGAVNRQGLLETAIKWTGCETDKNIRQYMGQHKADESADELWGHFQSIIHWAETTFTSYRKEMKGLDWGKLYSNYHNKTYDPAQVEQQVAELYVDIAVENKKGIFEFVLSEQNDDDYKLLNVRIFSAAAKHAAYALQTQIAQDKGVSNCPDCASSSNASKRVCIYSENDMEADHVTPWSKGGKTDAENCEMLCVRHNRAKGNR